MTDLASVLELSRSIDGWMTDEQAAMLHEAASRCIAGDRVVEIGSHHGKSTVVLASALPDGAELIAIDPFDDPRWGGGQAAIEVFKYNVKRAGAKDKVRLRRGLSGDVARAWPADQPVRLLYVDGAHDVETATEDLTLWKPHLTSDAMILVHDAFSSVGVTRAVLRVFATSDDYALTRTAGSLVQFSRGPVAPADRARLFLRLGFFLRNLLVKTALRQERPAVARALGHHGTHYPY